MGFANFCEFYAEFTPVTIAVRLIFATVLGGVIGLERATRHHTAGIRTFALVCLGSAISSVVNIYMVNSLSQAVILAKRYATPGQVVLFSPASTSFDMFKNMYDRGQKFKDIVNKM